MKISPLFKILIAPAAIAIAVAGIIESEAFPNGDETQRLERYKKGALSVPMPTNYQKSSKNQCLVKDPSSKISYYFYKSTSISSLQSLFSGFSKPINIGSIPNFDVINTGCKNLNVEGLKWNNFKEYENANKENLKSLKQKLKDLANQKNVSRFSRLISTVKPI